MADKLQDYYDNFLKQAIKSKEQLDSFMKQDDIRKKFTANEIKKLKDFWAGTPIETVVNTTIDHVEEVVQKQVEVVETAYEEVLSTLSKKNKKNK